MAVAPRPTSDHPGAAGPATPAATAVPGARAGLVVLVALLALCGLAAGLGGARAVPHATWVQTGAALVALGVLAAWVADRRPGAELGLRAPATAADTGPVPAPAGFVLRAPWPLWAAVAAVALLALLAAVSLAWSATPDRSWEVFNREAAYALVLVAGIAAGSSAPRALPRAAGGVVLVTTLVALWALAGVIAPDAIPATHDTARAWRLHAPLPTFTDLALLLGAIAPVAVRLAAGGVPGRAARLLALAATPVLLVALGMTGSRAGVAVLVLGLAASLVAGGARLRTLATAVAALAAAAAPLAVGLSSRALTTDGAREAARAHDGRTLGLVLLAAVVVLVLAGWAWLRAEPRLLAGATSRRTSTVAARRHGGRRRRRRWPGSSPWPHPTAASAGPSSHAADTFASSTRAPAHGGRERLTATDSGGRRALWDEALGAASDKPAGGWGAGAWPVVHAAYRGAEVPARDARSSVAQVLAERGTIGAVLLVAAALLLVAAPVLRLRALPPGPGRDLVAAVVGVAVAWTVGLLVASTWEVPAVTLPVLVLVAVAAARPGLPRHAAAVADPDPQTGGWRWGALAAGATLLALLATSALLPAWSRGREDTAWRLVSKPRATEQDLLDAAGAARLASKLDPPAVGPNLAAAAVAERRDGPSEARGELLEAVDEQPDSAVAWAALARLALRLADRPGGACRRPPRRRASTRTTRASWRSPARPRRPRHRPRRRRRRPGRRCPTSSCVVRPARRPRRRPRRPARGSAPCPRPRPPARRGRPRGSRPNGASVSVARRPLRATVHVPRRGRPTRNVAGIRRFFVMTAGRCSSATIRVRSAWASSTASNGARSRAGAAASSPGRGASGRSKSSRPASSRRTTSCSRRPLTTGPRPVRPDHVCTSAAVAGPNARRWWRTSASRAASRGRRRASSPSSARANAAARGNAQRSSVGTITSGSRIRTA